MGYYFTLIISFLSGSHRFLVVPSGSWIKSVALR